MNLSQLFPRIMGFLVIIITLALATSINTANAAIVADNLTNLIGMAVVASFGAPLIIFGLLAIGGVFAWAGTTGKLQNTSMSDLLGVIGSVIIVIVALTFMDTMIDYVNTLIDSSTGFGLVLYGVIPLIIYLGIIAGAGWKAVSTLRRGRKSSRRSAVGY